jgi:hypothetical protein
VREIENLINGMFKAKVNRNKTTTADNYIKGTLKITLNFSRVHFQINSIKIKVAKTKKVAKNVPKLVKKEKDRDKGFI